MLDLFGFGFCGSGLYGDEVDVGVGWGEYVGYVLFVGFVVDE